MSSEHSVSEVCIIVVIIISSWLVGKGPPFSRIAVSAYNLPVNETTF